MCFKKVAILCLLSFSLSNALAGNEDWNGVFTVKNNLGNLDTVKHTPWNVSYMFFSAGACMHFHKGASINNVVFKEDIDLCTKTNVETFEKEVQKLGVIVNKTVSLGPTYTA